MSHDMKTLRDVTRFARLSSDGRYRYNLARSWDPEAQRDEVIAFVMLNPSTADGVVDDATIRKLYGFAANWRAKAFEVVNLFAFRATDPADLLRAARAGVDVIGPENDAAITGVAARAGRLVCAWGATAVPGRDDRVRVVLEACERHGLEPLCLATTQAGQPRHPLYLPYTSNLSRWEPR